MAPVQDHQVEKLVDEAFKHNNFQDLEKALLKNEDKGETTIKCSRQFMTKLDKLFIREMDLGNVDNACLVLTVLHKYGEMLVFPGGRGISVAVSQGFVKKMVQWFEKARKLWVEAGSSRNETMIKLAEDFFDALMVVQESCKEGTYEVTEALLSHIGRLASDAQINIMIQKEAARKLNAILEKIPMELKKKKKILSTQEASSMMNAVAIQILKGGDYDLQVSLMEALCRMASPAQRTQLADSWFTMTFVSSAFKKIKDSQFETDCRKFLNMVNGMQGDGRSVYSYPCLEAFLDKHELLMPEDKNLEAFWIDFNLGSQSISFYFCAANKEISFSFQDGQWSTLCIVENEVQSYTVEEESGRKVLHLVLTEPACFDNLEGSRVTIKFSSSLDILRATESVFGQAKNRTSVRKSSVVKTPVHVNLSSQESSQVFVPESQVSPLRAEGKGSSLIKHGFSCQPPTHPTPDTNNVPLQMVTPIKMKVSESCTYISGSVGSKQGSCSSISVLPSVSKLMVKPALQMTSSSERKKEIELRELMLSKTYSSVPSLSFQCENNQKKAHANQAQLDVYPLISSPAVWSLNSSKRRISVSRSLLALQKDRSEMSDGGSHPPPQRLSPAQCASRALTQKQLHTQLTQRLEEVVREQQGTDGRTAQAGSSLEHRTAGQEKENMEKSVKSMPARAAQKRRKSSEGQGYTSDRDNLGMFSLKTSFIITQFIVFDLLRDVYAFTEDTPKISVRKKSSDASRVESSPLSKPQPPSKSAKRHHLTKAPKANEKKKLFSDTDTDNMTEISWLNSANRKPKPKVADYSRQPVKPIFPPADTAFKSPYTPLPSPKPVKEQIKPKRKRQKKMAEHEDKRQPSINNKKTTGRPQRAAALTRTYRETSDSDDQSSLSESEKAPAPKKKAVWRAATLHETVSAKAAEQGGIKQKTSVDIAKLQNEKNAQKKADKVFAKSLGGQRNDKGKKMCSPEHLAAKKTSSAQGSARRQKESWAARLSSTFASPPSVEKMRSGEKLKTNVRSGATPLRSLSISPIEADSSPLQPLSSLKASSLCKTPGNKAAVKQPSRTITPVSTTSRGSKRIPPAAQVEPSPVDSPDFQEEQRGVKNKTSPASFERRSIISVTMSQSSHVSVSNKLEKTPASQKGSKVEGLEFKSGPTAILKHLTLSHSASLSERDESEEDKENKAPSPSQLALKMKPRKLFVPTNKSFTPNKGSNAKPLVKDQSSSEEEEEDIVTENGRRKRSYRGGLNKRAKETTISSNERLERSVSGHKIRLRICLFCRFCVDLSSLTVPVCVCVCVCVFLKVLTNDSWVCLCVCVCPPVETLSSCTRSSYRHASEEDTNPTQPAQQVGFICHQFSSELKRKIKNRCRTMDLYTRQTLKTLGQHMSSVSVQVHQYSTQRLEKVKQVLLSEIANLEQDDTVLRSMEEELTTYWGNQTLAFHAYQEKGTKRLQELKSAFQTDVCESLEYEKEVFSVEMSLMKKSMKSVQERFFKEIHEEELTSVRRGLQSLFFPDASRF
ncbi:uncharacterized protein sycp2 [Puntigrus tetrazona]|uniref:uncharacterized protein sycp2 n=1 Tax=Puntigrus tetrazona TaxID=1606681 RepID=UPI001C89B59A|nr:uncharacterized protein sycp2 [Puntigrus tetrazona]